MSRTHGMTWTGLHVPQGRPPNPIPRRAGDTIPAPCEACSDRQQRACSAGPLTCSAYIRFQLRGGRQTRDVDDEPALAELAPLLDCDVRGAAAASALLRRAEQIVAAAFAADEPKHFDKPAAAPKARKKTATEVKILSALPLCDGTVYELSRICKLDHGSIRWACESMIKRGELVAVSIQNPRPLGPKNLMAFRRPA